MDEATWARLSAVRCIPVDRHTPERPGKGRGIGCGLRQSVHRLAAGQRVLMAFAPRETRQKPWQTEVCASLRRPVSVRRGRADRGGRSCNRGSTPAAAGARIRRDDSEASVALLRRTEEGCTKSWRNTIKRLARKRRRLKVLLADGWRRQRFVEDGTDGFLPLRQSHDPVWRLGAVDSPQRQRCSGQNFTMSSVDRLAESGAGYLPHVLFAVIAD